MGILYIPFKPSFADRVKVGRYSSVNDDINDRNFPIALAAGYSVAFKLFDFGPLVGSEEAIEAMGKRKFQPGNLIELFVLGRTFRNKEGGRIIIPALGSVWSHPQSGTKGVPVLNVNCVDRELEIDAFAEEWMRCRFFGVRKYPHR